MEYTVNLKLKIADNDIEGESSQIDNEREGTIECLSFSTGIDTSRDMNKPQRAQSRMFSPIQITKRVDGSSPLLLKACSSNEKVDGVFKLYRPSPAGDTASEHFYTVEITDARIQSVHQSSGRGTEATESVTFVYAQIRWAFEPTGSEAVDSVGGEA